MGGILYDKITQNLEDFSGTRDFSKKQDASVYLSRRFLKFTFWTTLCSASGLRVHCEHLCDTGEKILMQ